MTKDLYNNIWQIEVYINYFKTQMNIFVQTWIFRDLKNLLKRWKWFTCIISKIK